mmetsp:Transcript_23207/g.21096  ORF Transcript_23207/g.21096 Transcript_23207/m.21096 type:complete len:143 (-) Transcript_23207:71-499(-)
MGIFKSGRVVVVLAGRYAGRKAIVVKATDDGTKEKKFGHAIIAGIDRYPRKVTKGSSKEKIEKRTKIKPFLKVVNYGHIMPTRYTVDIELKKLIDENTFVGENRSNTRKEIKKIFEEKYKNQTAKNDKKAAGLQYFYNKLRF